MAGSAWQDEEMARRFEEERQSPAPFGAERIRLLRQVVEHLAPLPRCILELSVFGRTRPCQ